nr:uncharacterized protein LOC110360032 [Columba livia]
MWKKEIRWMSWRRVTWFKDSNWLLADSGKMICKATGSGPPLVHWQEWFDGQGPLDILRVVGGPLIQIAGLRLSLGDQALADVWITCFRMENRDQKSLNRSQPWSCSSPVSWKLHTGLSSKGLRTSVHLWNQSGEEQKQCGLVSWKLLLLFALKFFNFSGSLWSDHYVCQTLLPSSLLRWYLRRSQNISIYPSIIPACTYCHFPPIC